MHNVITRQFSTLERWLDYIPVLSSITNLGALAYKSGAFTPRDNTHPFYAHLKNKSVSRCVTLLIPFFGNVLVFLEDVLNSEAVDDMFHDMIVHSFHEVDPEKVIKLIDESVGLQLDLSKLGFRTLPEEIGELQHLTKLFLYTNRLSSLPHELWQLNALNELDLSGNKLTELPGEIALLSNLKRINLGYNKLTALPPEIGMLNRLQYLGINNNKLLTFPAEMGQMSRLTELCAYRNRITALPNEFGRLRNLEKLNLEGNQLTAFPKMRNLTWLSLESNQFSTFPLEVCELERLKTLFFYNNQITSVPREIGNLVNLSLLTLSYNRLTAIPVEICDLNFLSYLGLSGNQLRALPPQLGNLLNLSHFYFSNNPHLRELPLSLGEIPGLTHFELRDTAVDPRASEAILRQCRLMRRNEMILFLPGRLDKWKTMAKSHADFSKFRELSVNKQYDLNEWLHRLEKTNDFGNNHTLLAVSVCRILKDVLEDQPFQELFFSQVRVNNESCEDRASMSLNEIYTSWTILCMAKSLSLQKKLKLMTGVAKTLCLRKEIAKRISDRIEEESVEIYLYYETRLRERLKLVTAVSAMAHEEIGKRSWIDEEQLVKDVNAHFFEELYDLPIFQKTIEEDPEIQNRWNAIFIHYCQRLEDDHANADRYLKRWKNEKIEVAKEWYKDVLDI